MKALKFLNIIYLCKYISSLTKTLNSLMDLYIKHRLTLFNRIFIIIDFIVCMFIYKGIESSDYFMYIFYGRKHIERKNFITLGKNDIIIQVLNNSLEKDIFDDKSAFNKRFSNYLGRDWIEINNSNREEFYAFVTDHKRFIVKGKRGGGGESVYFLEIDDSTDIKLLYEELASQDAIVEEVIKQIYVMSEFHPESVNTIRVTSLISDNDVRIIAAAFRIGNKGNHIDNFHADGIAAAIDVESGVVSTAAVDRYNNKYNEHPITKKRIKGFQIPMWKEIIDTVINAAHILPSVRYVGWDIVITEDKRVCFIEGNGRPGADLIQMPDQIGKWGLFKEFL